MSKLVTVFGGAGFVGRYTVQRLAEQGWRVRVACRRPNDAIFVRCYGTPGQVEPILCNIRDDSSVRAALIGADAALNCVGILSAHGKNSFEAVQAEGAGRVARIAAQEGVGTLVHISAIGANEAGKSAYARSKAAGEALVRHAFPLAVILRPSVIFGPEDDFFNRFSKIACLSPIVPLAQADTLFQPVYVVDVARAAVRALEGGAEVKGKTYELGGPDVMSLRALIAQMCAVIERRRLILNMPYFMAAVMAGGFDLLHIVSLGLFKNSLLTRDQLRSLLDDNIVASGAKGLSDLGMTPTGLEAVLPEYLWRYRPFGQFAAIKKSAKNLKRS